MFFREVVGLPEFGGIYTMFKFLRRSKTGKTKSIKLLSKTTAAVVLLGTLILGIVFVSYSNVSSRLADNLVGCTLLLIAILRGSAA